MPGAFSQRRAATTVPSASRIEVSAGVNFFNPGANTAVFAKLDVTFGDNIDGVGGKAGMRVSW
jgi:hypothetical protein